jgi:hypothetical protein
LAAPGIEPKTSRLAVRNSDHWTTEEVKKKIMVIIIIPKLIIIVNIMII